MVTGTTYDPANRLLSISGNALTESREYNTMGQLTQIISSASGGSSLNITYNYSSTQNNGKITSQTDNISGEQVVYAYDALNRLASAAATSGFWGQGYAYDGFGNLTDQTVTASSGGTTVPTLSVVYNASNNLQTTDCADANGNILAQSVAPWTCSNTPNGTEYTYDMENRMHPPSLYGVGSFYSYAPGNKRVWRGNVNSSGTTTLDEVTFWSVTGKKLATYNLIQTANASSTVLYANVATTSAYFGGRLIANSTGNVVTDRLGSVGKYYPWGQEKPSATANGTEKFTGYFRDAETSLDYAINRYHQPGMGRFMSPDPYQASGGPHDPGSWNRYAYVGGDPVSRVDHKGLYYWDTGDADESDDGSCGADWMTDASLSGPCNGSSGTGGGGLCGGNSFFNASTGSCEEDSTTDADPPPPPCSNWGCMPPAFARALQALTLNSGCLDLFGNAQTRAGNWNPITVLTSLFVSQNGVYGSVNFNYTGNGSAKTTPHGFLLGSLKQGVTGSSATISINSTYWNTNNVDFNAETLLHEMAHLYDFVRGSGGFALSNPAEAHNASAFDTLIDQQCNLNPQYVNPNP